MCHTDEDVLTAFLGNSERDETVVRQYMTVIPSPEGSRRLLSTYYVAESGPPVPPIQSEEDCAYGAELTFYLTFPKEVEELLMNQVSPWQESTSRTPPALLHYFCMSNKIKFFFK